MTSTRPQVTSSSFLALTSGMPAMGSHSPKLPHASWTPEFQLQLPVPQRRGLPSGNGIAFRETEEKKSSGAKYLINVVEQRVRCGMADVARNRSGRSDPEGPN